jgi:hypothetical protein
VLSLIARSHPDVLAGLADLHAAAKVVSVKLSIAAALFFGTDANRKQQHLLFYYRKLKVARRDCKNCNGAAPKTHVFP